MVHQPHWRVRLPAFMVFEEIWFFLLRGGHAKKLRPRRWEGCITNGRGSQAEQGSTQPLEPCSGCGPPPRVSSPGHWGFGWPSLARSSCIMPGCPRPNPCPRGLLLAGNGVPSDLGGLGSGVFSGWRSLCSEAGSSSSGGGLGGSSCCSGARDRRKEGRERRCEALRERKTRLLGMETSRRDPGSRASLQVP